MNVAIAWSTKITTVETHTTVKDVLCYFCISLKAFDTVETSVLFYARITFCHFEKPFEQKGTTHT